jgi:hypothetical protein
MKPDICNPGAFKAEAIRARFVEQARGFFSLNAGRAHPFFATPSQALCSRVSAFVQDQIRQLTVPDWSVFNTS